MSSRQTAKDRQETLITDHCRLRSKKHRRSDSTPSTSRGTSSSKDTGEKVLRGRTETDSSHPLVKTSSFGWGEGAVKAGLLAVLVRVERPGVVLLRVVQPQLLFFMSVRRAGMNNPVCPPRFTLRCFCLFAFFYNIFVFAAFAFWPSDRTATWPPSIMTLL